MSRKNKNQSTTTHETFSELGVEVALNAHKSVLIREGMPPLQHNQIIQAGNSTEARHFFELGNTEILAVVTVDVESRSQFAVVGGAGEYGVAEFTINNAGNVVIKNLVELKDNQKKIIGRSDRADLMIEGDSMVSREHVAIELGDGDIFISDHSQNHGVSVITQEAPTVLLID